MQFFLNMNLTNYICTWKIADDVTILRHKHKNTIL